MEPELKTPTPRRWLRDATLFGIIAAMCLGLSFLHSAPKILLLVAAFGFVVASGLSVRRMIRDRRRLLAPGPFA
jgi:predicted outer membrane lipoprotein